MVRTVFPGVRELGRMVRTALPGVRELGCMVRTVFLGVRELSCMVRAAFPGVRGLSCVVRAAVPGLTAAPPQRGWTPRSRMQAERTARARPFVRSARATSMAGSPRPRRLPFGERGPCACGVRRRWRNDCGGRLGRERRSGPPHAARP